MQVWCADIMEERENQTLGGADEGFFHFTTKEEALAFARELCKHRSLPTPYPSGLVRSGDKHEFNVVEEEASISEVKNHDEIGSSFYREAPVYLTTYKNIPAHMVPGEPYAPARNEKLYFGPLCRGNLRPSGHPCSGSSEEIQGLGATNIRPYIVSSYPIRVYPLEIELYDTPEEALERARTHLKGYSGFNL